MTCIAVFMQSSPGNLPDWVYDEFGRVQLDLGCSQFERSQLREEFVELDAVTGAGVLGFTLADTHKNRLILKDYDTPSIYGAGARAVIPVVAFESSRVLRQDTLKVLQKVKGGWECDLLDGDIFWRTALRDFKLDELKYPVIHLTDEYVRSNWAMGKYLDGDDGVYLQPAHYGNWEDEALYDDTDSNPDTPDELVKSAKMRPSDVRPFFHLLNIYQRVFCEKGWEFRSPIFETNWGRRLIFQALKDLGKIDKFESGRQLGVRASYTADQFWIDDALISTGVIFIQALLLRFDDDFTAPNYDAAAGQGEGYYDFVPQPPGFEHFYIANFSGTHDFTVSVDMDLAQGTRINLCLVRTINPNAPLVVGGSSDETFFSPQITLSAGPGQNVTYTWENIEAAPNQYFRAYIIGLDLDVFMGLSTIKPTTYWQTNPKKLTIKEGMYLPLGLLISPEFNFLEVLAAGAHLVGNGLFITDVCARTVTLYQENFARLWGGAEPEPFYPLEKQGFAPKLVCEEHTTELSPIQETRFYKLKFADTDDKYIEDVRLLDNDNPPFARVIDFGDDPRYVNDTEDNTNPLFQPTMDIRAEDVEHTDAVDSIGEPIDRSAELPALWDNSDFEVSEEIGPRILLVFGEALQFRGETSPGVITTAEFTWEYNTQAIPENPQEEIISRIPTASMCPEQRLLSLGGIGPLAPNENIVYGEKDRDLFMFWSLKIKELYEAFRINHQSLMTGCEFDSTNFRQLWDMYYRGQVYRAKLLGLESFLSCGKDPLNVALQSMIQDDYCYVDLPCTTLGLLGHNAILDIVTVTISGCDEYTISWGYLAPGNLPQFDNMERIPYQGAGTYFVSITGCGCTNSDLRTFPV